MTCQNCNNTCGNCPWVRDPHQDGRYVCLTCGKERWISENWGEFSFFLLVLVAIAVALALLTGCTVPSHESRLPTVETPQRQPTLIR